MERLESESIESSEPEFYKSPEDVKEDIPSSPQPIGKDLMDRITDRWGEVPEDL